MNAPRIEPWIDPDEYSAFKRLAPDDRELPDSYKEWLELAIDQLSAFVKSGIPVEKVLIHPEPFKEYCRANSINPDGVARAAFAVSIHSLPELQTDGV